MDTSTSTTADAAQRSARARIDPVDAGLLLAHVLEKNRTWLYAHGDHVLTAHETQRFHDMVMRRAAGEPVAYLVGRRGFRNLDLSVTVDTLIPRPETELLVEFAVQRIPYGSSLRVADLGTGSGAIALAIAAERPDVTVVATDASRAALQVARGNAEALGLCNVAFMHGDWLQPLNGQRFALIASNPPYIAASDPHLVQGDLRFEPTAALASGKDGLDAIRTIARDAPAHLCSGGWLLVEHGWTQGAAVRALLRDRGFVDVVTERDLEDRDRVTLGRLTGASIL